MSRILLMFTCQKSRASLTANDFLKLKHPGKTPIFRQRSTGPPIACTIDAVTPAVHPRIRPGKNELNWFKGDVPGSACASYCLSRVSFA